MKKTNFKLSGVIAFLMTLCILLSGCNTAQDTDDAGYSVPDVKYEYLSEERLDSVKKSLVKLLENICPHDILGNENVKPPYPDRPFIYEGHAYALFDVTGDGVPELLVHQWGFYGSGDYEYYDVYDIESGKNIGGLDGGEDTNFCLYYDNASKSFKTVARFYTRDGDKCRYRSVVTVEYDAEKGKYYTAEKFKITEEDVLGTDSLGNIDIVSRNVKFCVEGKEVGMIDYFDEYSAFTLGLTKVPDTEIVFVRNSVTSDTDSNLTKAQKLADALFSTGQRYIVAGQ